MADESQFSSSRPDNKRKFDDPSPPPPLSYNSVPLPLDGIQLAKLKAQEIAAKLFSESEAKRPKADNGAAADGHMQKPFNQMPSHAQPASFSSYGYGNSKKIDIPNGRVGVIIGKAGETIKTLQQQSGAKIQVTRDMDADPNSQTRPVEITGTLEQISRAEQLINEVLAEADAGSSGIVSGRKFGGDQPGTEHFSMKVPNNKVGLIIGKGGESIKSMQANSGARVQVIPLHLPPGDTSTERTVHIEGTSEQIEAAKKLVNEIVSGEVRFRNPQQSYHPPQPSSWGPPGPQPQLQQPGYNYMQQPGAYPQYSQPPYGGYPPQPATAFAGYSSGWDQSSTQGTQQTNPGTGYDYYSQQQQQQPPPPPPTSAPADNSSYNYSQQTYGGASYYQSGQQQSYGRDNYAAAGYNAQATQSGYSQPTSDTQAGYEQSYGSALAYAGATANPAKDGSTPSQPAAPVQPSPTQQGYGSQPPSSTPPSYPSQVTSQSGYGVPPISQQGYAQPGYGQSPQGQKPPATLPVYGQPPSSQAAYPAPAQASYGQTYQQVPSYGGQAGYGQQQSYGDSYGSGEYAQPPAYGSEGGTAPAAAPGSVNKASPKS